ncbi:hypothetical protein NE577_16300 [Cloacibacillus evryensis]|nr:hypothetical protein [Cloacibacillus evryensis]
MGGRLVKVENDFITYVYPKIEKIAADNGLAVKAGENPEC